MTKFLQYISTKRESTRISIDAPNFEYLALKEYQKAMHNRKLASKFNTIKRVAIYQLGCQTLKALQIIQDDFGCDREYYANHELPNKLFGWRRKDYEHRRNMGMFWLNVMERYITDDCLEQKKFYNDLEQIQIHLRKIFQSYIKKQNTPVKEEMEDMHDYMFRLEQLYEELGENKKLDQKLFDAAYQIMNQKTMRTSVDLCGEYTSERIIEPIRERYQYNVLEGKVAEANLRASEQERQITEKILAIKKKIEREQVAHNLVMITFADESDKLRLQLSDFEGEYDYMYEIQKAKQEYKLSKIAKMKGKCEAYLELLNFFRSVIAESPYEDQAAALRRSTEAKLLQGVSKNNELHFGEKIKPNKLKKIQNPRKEI